MIFRRKDGTYCLSSADGEFARDVSKKVGDKLLHQVIGREEAERCIKENREVFVS